MMALYRNLFRFYGRHNRAIRPAFGSTGCGLALAWPGGFNLLPWRQRRMARARRHRLYEWGAALALGCCCAAAQAGWQTWQRMTLDAARGEVERSLAALRVPLAEYGRLTREAAARRTQLETVAIQSAPLTHLLDLFDALGRTRADGVELQQVTHDARATVLQATVESGAAADAWLARLHTVADVQRISIPELKRPDASRVPHPASGARDAQNAPLQMSVHLLWKEALDGAVPDAGVPGGALKTGTSGIKGATSGIKGVNKANAVNGTNGGASGAYGANKTNEANEINGANETNGMNGTNGANGLDGAKRMPISTADHNASRNDGGAIR